MTERSGAPIRSRLLSVGITGFRSLRTMQELRVEPDVTVLAGRNNVGKTAILHALTLPTTDRPGRDEAAFRLKMKWSIAGDELRSALQVKAWSVGPVTALLRSGEGFELEYEVQPLQDPAALPAASQEVLEDSVIVVGGTPSLQVSAAHINGNLLSFVRKHGRSRGSGHGTFTWGDETNPILHAVADLPGRVFRLCTDLFASFFYVGPRRTIAPLVMLQNASALAPDGANLTNVLADLYNNQRHTIYPKIEDFIRAAFPEILHIDVRLRQTTPSPTAEVYVIYPGQPTDAVPLEHCGTGIEQLLILAAAILGSSTRRVFLIDEPHAFLHPHAERCLLRLMRGHPEHQYIVATHSALFLRTAQLRRERLVKRDASGTVIKSFDAEPELLTEMGVTANDVWSSDAILWVEGPTEVGIYEVLGDHNPDLMEGVRVKSLPDFSRATRSTPREIRRVIALVRAVGDALSTFGVRTHFLFDPLDLPEGRKKMIVNGSGGTATFQGCPEVENLLLHAGSVTTVLNRRRRNLSLQPVPEEAVSRRMDQLLSRLENTDLYPSGATGPNRETVRGLQLLRAVFQSFDDLGYDRVRDGRAIATEVIAAAPQRLVPLEAAVEALKAV